MSQRNDKEREYNEIYCLAFLDGINLCKDVINSLVGRDIRGMVLEEIDKRVKEIEYEPTKR
jgi:hypothetical protein